MCTFSTLVVTSTKQWSSNTGLEGQASAAEVTLSWLSRLAEGKRHVLVDDTSGAHATHLLEDGGWRMLFRQLTRDRVWNSKKAELNCVKLIIQVRKIEALFPRFSAKSRASAPPAPHDRRAESY